MKSINLVPLLCLAPLVLLLSGGGRGNAEEPEEEEEDPDHPEIPTEPPRPRPTPKTFTFKALHRYDVVADVLPVAGLEAMALQAFPLLGFAGVDVLAVVTSPVKRGGRTVQRVTLRTNVLVGKAYALERENAYAGVGSIWLVSAKDIGEF